MLCAHLTTPRFFIAFARGKKKITPMKRGIFQVKLIICPYIYTCRYAAPYMALGFVLGQNIFDLQI
jgi:hypothetical protein